MIDNEAKEQFFKLVDQLKVRRVKFHTLVRKYSLVKLLEIRTVFYLNGEEEEGNVNPRDLGSQQGHNSVPERLQIAFSNVFNQKAVARLPINKVIDHTIDLLPGFEPVQKQIYLLSLAKQKALKEFINKALKKGQIRKSNSLAGALILFV